MKKSILFALFLIFLIGFISACHTCGNNVQEEGEECDDGWGNGWPCSPSYGSSCTYCSNSCKLITIYGSYCGDGVKNPCYENCENCPEDYGECPVPECGNGNQEDGEECDDGNLVDGDGCSSICEIEEIPEPYCGDETCNNDETCSTCPSDCGQCPVEPFCGDGNLDEGEECDDGNLINGDGCSSECKIETEEEDSKVRKEIVIMDVCDPNWQCFGWSSCINGIMTRQCYDTNHCDVEYNKPLEKSGCEELVSKVYVKDDMNSIWIFIGIIIFVILLFVLINLLR